MTGGGGRVGALTPRGGRIQKNGRCLIKKLLKTAAGAMALAVVLSAGSGFACGSGAVGNTCGGRCGRGMKGTCNQIGINTDTGLPICRCQF